MWWWTDGSKWNDFSNRVRILTRTHTSDVAVLRSIISSSGSAPTPCAVTVMFVGCTRRCVPPTRFDWVVCRGRVTVAQGFLSSPTPTSPRVHHCSRTAPLLHRRTWNLMHPETPPELTNFLLFFRSVTSVPKKGSEGATLPVFRPAIRLASIQRRRQWGGSWGPGPLE